MMKGINKVMLPIKINLPENFLEEEVRCNYTITQKMKKVWAVEIDLLVEFQRVCKKYNLRYFAWGGTLLGTIRHQGFIPWDDDIDVVMLRDDYNKLIKVAKNEFKHPYFFQTEDTDRFSIRGHAQIRNSLTTGVLSSETKYKFRFNQGIFLDIFILDNVPVNEEQRIKFYKKANKIKKKMFFFRNISCKESLEGSHGLKKLVKSFLYLFFHDKRNPYFSKLHKYSSSLKGKTKVLGDCIFETGKPELIFDASLFEMVESKPFEFISVAVPKEYGEVLDISFGDWKKYVIGTSDHGGVIFDTDNSYKSLIKNEL